MGNASPTSDATIEYVPSADSDTEFDSSDEEPLAKYRTKSNGDLKKERKDKSDGESSRGHGRHRGKAQPGKKFQMAGFNRLQRNVRRDRVDEECTRLGIVYRQWKPLNPDQESHPSIMFFNEETIVPEEQKIPDWCILCPRNKVMRDKGFCQSHYLRVHHKKLIVVENYKMLSCKCSDLLATHIITNHQEVDLPQIHHLMHESNPHRMYDYEQ